MAVPGNIERKPYRIVRGSYSRRDGNKVVAKDADGQRLGGSVQEFTYYSARTANNPQAKDEIMLSDKEAAALGNRVVPLVRGNVETAAFDRDHVQEAYTLDQLIETGLAVSGTRSLNDFRDMVFKSGLIVGSQIPTKKHEIVALLRQIKTKIAREAADLGLRPIGGENMTEGSDPVRTVTGRD